MRTYASKKSPNPDDSVIHNFPQQPLWITVTRRHPSPFGSACLAEGGRADEINARLPTSSNTVIPSRRAAACRGIPRFDRRGAPRHAGPWLVHRESLAKADAEAKLRTARLGPAGQTMRGMLRHEGGANAPPSAQHDTTAWCRFCAATHSTRASPSLSAGSGPGPPECGVRRRGQASGIVRARSACLGSPRQPGRRSGSGRRAVQP